MNLIVKTAAAAALFLTPVVATAAPITGGSTTVRVLVPLPGVTPGVTGNATVLSLSPLDLSFPITGGELEFTGPNGIEATIEHDDSGFTLDFGGNLFAAANLLIDTVAGTVFADASVNGASEGNVQLFSFDISGVTVAQLTDLSSPFLQLDIAQPLVDLLARFGVETDTDQRFGTVSTAPQIADVPAPAALALFGLGIVGLAAARRRA